VPQPSGENASIPYAGLGVSTGRTDSGGGALHLIALFTVCATFPLIFMGGLVTSHQAGMSVPDWPNSYGYNMFLFPPRLWIGGILYEHTHRLMGTVVGLLSITLVVASFVSKWAGKRERILAAAVLAAVIFQGVLGGLRVVLVKLDLAIVHACVAQAFFCLVAFVALATSRWWHQFKEPSLGERAKGHVLVMLGLVTVAAIYLQLIVGAMMRHFQAGLAIPDLPLAYGGILPPLNQAQLDAANWTRVRALNLDSVTLGQVWLHFGHRIGAIVVGGLVLALAMTTLRRYATRPKLVRPAWFLLAMLLAQLTLGVLTVLYRKPADVASAHVAVGALVLVTAFVLTARAIRIFGWRRPAREIGAAGLRSAGVMSPA
jgi:cytochrome c oxidase assembly protein subunit 15